ncbi:hypothetical protein Tco_0569425 [Tanacetum coccineum]
MAQLKYCDKHNQVGFLRKPDESAGFAEIVDFLRGSNLRYALTTNPTIYDSLVKQFWQSAIANTRADGSLEINATIDTIRYTISEASIRDSLQLDDATGITMLPNADLFEGMGQIGYPTDGTFTFWKSFFTPQWRFLVHHLLHCISSKSGGWDQFGSNIATALICLSTGQEHDAVAQSKPLTSSPQVAPQLISRIDSWKRISNNQVPMGNALVKLVKKVKKLEGFLKRRNMVLSDSEEEEPEAQGRKSQDDPLDSLVQGLVTPSTTKVNCSWEEQVEDISPNTLEAAKISLLGCLSKAKFCSEQVSTVGAKKSTPSPDKGQREGKAPMISEETPKKSKETIVTREASLLKHPDCLEEEETNGNERIAYDLDKDDSEGSDEVSEQDDSVTGTKIPINPVPVAMKSPSIATYKIIKQGEKGVYQ